VTTGLGVYYEEEKVGQRSQETDDVDVEKRGVDSGRDKMSHIERNDHM